MKKNSLTWLMFLLITLMFILNSCNKAPSSGPRIDVDEIKTPLSAAVLRLVMSTGATNSSYYPFGSALAQVVDDSSSYLVIDTLTSTDFTENIERILNGEAQLAIIQNDILSNAFYGSGVWSEKPSVATMVPLMALYPEICQVVVGANSGLITIADLKGRRVAIGEDDTALQGSALRILREYNLTEEDIEALPFSFGEAAQAMQEKSIDAFFITAGTPNKAIMDLQTEREITVIGPDENTIDSLTQKYPFYTRYTLDENDYSFLSEPVNTVAVKATLVASASLSEQAAYDIVKTIIENRDKIAVIHAKGMYIDAENAVDGLPIDFHPGARRYFEEIGALIP